MGSSRVGDKRVRRRAPRAKRRVLDANGWPLDCWALFGALDGDFDVGDRSTPPERPDPLGSEDTPLA